MVLIFRCQGVFERLFKIHQLLLVKLFRWSNWSKEKEILGVKTKKKGNYFKVASSLTQTRTSSSATYVPFFSIRPPSSSQLCNHGRSGIMVVDGGTALTGRKTVILNFPPVATVQHFPLQRLRRWHRHAPRNITTSWSSFTKGSCRGTVVNGMMSHIPKNPNTVTVTFLLQGRDPKNGLKLKGQPSKIVVNWFLSSFIPIIYLHTNLET